MDSPSLSLAAKFSNLNYRNSTAKLLAKSITGKSCSICLSAVVDRRAAVVIPCMHAYCVGCIRKWSDLKRKCPLCNSEFDSWYHNINLSSRTFRKEKLEQALAKDNDVVFHDIYARRRRRLVERQRLIRRSGEELNALRSRTRPAPRQRSFGRHGDERPDVIAERVLRWRASIYEQQLQAVPFASNNCLMPQLTGSDDAKRILLQRIEPWIQRELHAILRDPDPSVIIHVVTSLFISSYQKKQRCPSGQLTVQNDFLAPLRTFLHERTEMFWHELRKERCIPYNNLKQVSIVWNSAICLQQTDNCRNLASRVPVFCKKAVQKIQVPATSGIGFLKM